MLFGKLFCTVLTNNIRTMSAKFVQSTTSNELGQRCVSECWYALILYDLRRIPNNLQQRFQTKDREILPSDLRVLYLLGEVDSYDSYEERPVVTCQVSQQKSLEDLFANATSNYEESMYEDESLPSNYISPAPLDFNAITHSVRPEPKQQKSSAKSAKKELHEQLIRCRIEREKAKTELLKAQRRLVEAQLRNMDKNGGGSFDLLLSVGDTFKN